MPTYDYLCPQCGKFEMVQSITAEPLSECPTCKSPVKRLISGGINIIFKGSGFYSTDYRSSSYTSKASAESGADKSSSKAEASSGSSGSGSGSAS